MKKNYKLVVFDWEGTLGDTLGQVINTIEKEAILLNLKVFDKSLANKYISFGLVHLIKKIYPDLTLDLQNLLISAVEKSLITNNKEICLIPDADWIVKLLYQNGYILGLASNKGRQSLQKVLITSGLNKYFSIIRSATDTSPKPCPQMLEEIIKEGGVDHAETLMIGDSVTDIEMANKINVDAIGVDFYNGDNDLLFKAGALKVFNNYQQLAGFLTLEGNNVCSPSRLEVKK